MPLSKAATNLLKQIVNTITKFVAHVISLGKSKHVGLFKVEKSKGSTNAEELGKKITDSLVGNIISKSGN